jgi:hypothetical protein
MVAMVEDDGDGACVRWRGGGMGVGNEGVRGVSYGAGPVFNRFSVLKCKKLTRQGVPVAASPVTVCV